MKSACCPPSYPSSCDYTLQFAQCKTTICQQEQSVNRRLIAESMYDMFLPCCILLNGFNNPLEPQISCHCKYFRLTKTTVSKATNLDSANHLFLAQSLHIPKVEIENFSSDLLDILDLPFIQYHHQDYYIFASGINLCLNHWDTSWVWE